MSLKSETPNLNTDLGPEESPPIPLNHRSKFVKWLRKPLLFLHENGFRIWERGKDQIFLYSEIQRLSAKETSQFTNGIQTGIKYYVMITARDKRVLLSHVQNSLSPDPFGSFLSLLIQRLADQFEKTPELRADNWFLDTIGFHSNSETVKWEDIGYVDLTEGHVAIWRRQQTYPFTRVPFASPQARILNEILERHTKKNPDPLAPDSLGRFLFKRRANQILIFIAAGVCTALFLTGIWLWKIGSGTPIIAIVLLLLSGLMATYGLYLLRGVFHFYQNGIIQEPGHIVLFYNRCDTLIYDVNLQFVNALYAFTRVVLKLRDASRTLKLRTQFFGNDMDLEQARVEMARRISERMYLKLATQEEIAWGKWARLSAHELHYLSTGLLRSTARFTVPYTQPISYSIDAGKFYLFRAGEPEPLFEMDCSEENFYPGFFLLLKLVSEH